MEAPSIAYRYGRQEPEGPQRGPPPVPMPRWFADYLREQTRHGITGTRHLIMVYYKGKWMIAQSDLVQYGPWNGCPSGQGADVLTFLQTPGNIERLMAVLDKPHMLYTPSDEEVDHFRRLNPGAAPPETISRRTGARILDIVASAVLPMPIKINLVDFFNAFIDWSYVIDLDMRRLEVSGFAKNGYTELEGDWWESDKIRALEEEYHQRRSRAILGCHSFDALPTDWRGLAPNDKDLDY